MYALLILLFSSITRQQLTDAGQDLEAHASIDKLLEKIRLNYTDITLEDLSRMSGYSKWHLSRMIKKNTGTSLSLIHIYGSSDGFSMHHSAHHYIRISAELRCVLHISQNKGPAHPVGTDPSLLIADLPNSAQICALPVSYTHLDVYKRQALRMPTSLPPATWMST